MALSADTLLERSRLKQQVTRWRILALVAFVAVVAVLFDQFGGSGTGTIERDHIARFTLEGVILDDLAREEQLAELRSNPRVKAVLVRLDTPGGSAVAGMELYRRLREIADSGKPVVAVMRDVAASAGYLAALGADRIYANEGTLTGSIGVIIQTAEFSELAEKIGVRPVTIKTGKMKDALSPYRPVEPEARDMLQGVIDDFFAVFVATVAERRELSEDKVRLLADGRIFSGVQAERLHLIDAIGNEQDALAWLESEKKITKGLPLKDVHDPMEDLPFIQQFMGGVMQKFSPFASGTLDGLVAIWHPSLQIQ